MLEASFDAIEKADVTEIGVNRNLINQTHTKTKRIFSNVTFCREQTKRRK